MYYIIYTGQFRYFKNGFYKVKEIKEYTEYKGKISQIFKSKSIKTAMKRFNKLNEKFDEMPEIIQIFMKKLSKKLEITLNHTKNRKIPSTNNLAALSKIVMMK